MITIFTIPKPFKGHINIIQRNAINSWMQLQPKCEVFLFGDDEGVKETANELGVLNIAEIEKNEYGTPLLSSAFSIAQNQSSNEILVYVNADIIFLQDLVSTITKIHFNNFLICGRRWDLNIKNHIDFNDKNWRKVLIKKCNKENLHGYSGIDYFIFNKGLVELPKFAVGRPGWDNWVLYNMKTRKIPIINATANIITIHQNHDYNHSNFNEINRIIGPEYKKNIQLANGLKNMLTIREADFVIKNNSIKKPQLHNLIFSYLSRFYFWRLIMGIKRNFQEKFLYN